MTDLQPIKPERAAEMYLRDRSDELAEATIEMQEHHLQYFTEWCDEHGIDNLNDISGRNLHEYKISRKERGLSRATRRTQLSTLRVFLNWCRTIEAVPDELHDKVVPPSLQDEDRRDEMVSGGRAKSILDHLDAYQYASREHTIFRLLFRTGMRMGAVRGLDVDDYDPKAQLVEIRHRPETDTPLKNGRESERSIALTEKTCDVLTDYIKVHRHDVTDDNDRVPLFTTRNGRIGKSMFRRTVYAVTRPCKYENSCPHGKEPLDCEAARKVDYSFQCPSSKSPHPVRRGSITWHLLNDTPETVVADRCDLGEDVMEQHYDQRTEKEQMEARRDFIDNL